MATTTSCTISDENIRQTAENSISNLLKDPSSAQFSDEFLVENLPDDSGYQNINVCGLVNGKNSFGAFSGSTRFVVALVVNRSQNILEATDSELDDGNDQATLSTENQENKETVFEQVYWNKMCINSQHPAMYTGQSEN